MASATGGTGMPCMYVNYGVYVCSYVYVCVNCSIGELIVIIDILQYYYLKFYLQTVFYHGILQTFKHLSSEKKSDSDKFNSHLVYRREPNLVIASAIAWYGLVCKSNGRSRTIVFPFRRRREKVTHCSERSEAVVIVNHWEVGRYLRAMQALNNSVQTVSIARGIFVKHVVWEYEGKQQTQT